MKYTLKVVRLSQ